MTTVYPNASANWNQLFITPVNAATFHEALDTNTTTYVKVTGNYAAVDVAFPVPSELSDDYAWAGCQLSVAGHPLNTPALGDYVDVTYVRNSAIHAQLFLPQYSTGWQENYTKERLFDSRRFYAPRSVFLNEWFRVTGHTVVYGQPTNIGVNNLRIDVLGVSLPPTATVVGPIGLTTIIGGAYLPVQWTYSSPPGLPQAAATVQVSTDVTGAQIIYSATVTGTATTHTIPAWALAQYVGEPLYVWVRAAHTPDNNSGDPNNRWLYTVGQRQYGPFTSAPFTPTGEVVVSFQASRPLGFVNEFSVAARERITASHSPVVSAVLYDSLGVNSWELDVVDGSVTIDAGSKTRSTCSLTVTNSELRPLTAYPVDSDRPLHPFGSYIQLARGVDDEPVALGAFVVDSVSIDLSDTIREFPEPPVVPVDIEAEVTVAYNAGLYGAGVYGGGSAVAPAVIPPVPSQSNAAVDVSGSDWSLWLADARLTYDKARHAWNGVAYAPNLVTTAMADLITEAGLTPVINGSNDATVAVGLVHTRTSERPSLLSDLADSIGWWWYADTYGQIVCEPRPSAGEALYRFAEGANCVVIRQTSELSRSGMSDLVVAYDPDGRFVGGAADSNAASPIRRGMASPMQPSLGAGAFSPGGKPFFFASPVIADLAGAQSAAATVLLRSAVPSDTVTLSIVPAPDLRPGHVIELSRTGMTTRNWTVEKVTIPLGVEDAMTVEASAPADYITPLVGP